MSGETQPKKAIYKKWWFWLIIVVVVGIIAANSKNDKVTTGDVQSNQGSTGQSSSQGESKTEAPPVTPTIKVTAEQYFKDYEENEVAADGKYEDKKIEITGEISSIDKVLGSISVHLKTDNLIGTVSCGLEDEKVAATLKKGGTVTLIGTGAGKSLFPEVKDCVVK